MICLRCLHFRHGEEVGFTDQGSELMWITSLIECMLPVQFTVTNHKKKIRKYLHSLARETVGPPDEDFKDGTFIKSTELAERQV
jgi:hypothetical protein